MSRTKGLDLVLVNPASRKQVYQRLGDDLAAVEPPVWVGMLAAFVRAKGYRVDVVDAEAENLSPREVTREVSDRRPALTAVVVYGHNPSASTQVMPAARAICAAIKESDPEQKILLLGGHVAALSERTLREEPCDFVCRGEGFWTLIDLLEALSAVNPDLSQVRDLGYRDGKNIGVGRPGALLTELDQEVPALAWDMLPMDNYRAHNWHCLGQLQRRPYAALYTTLGCPYRCSFCCIQAPFKSGEARLGYKTGTNSYRFWSPETVVDQLEHLAERYQITNVKIADEMFVLHRKHVESICELIIERGLHFNIWAYARVDTVRDGLAEKLKRAGFNWLALGIEAGNERVRSDVHKGFRQEDVFAALAKVRAAGIHVIGNYILGLPEDTRATMQETLDLALELNCEFANFYSTMAYPGSPLYNIAVANGWPLPESWSGYAQHAVDTLPLPTRHVSASEVLGFRDHAFRTYFGSAGYLRMVKRKFGEGSVQHIRHMNSFTLLRNCA